MYRRYRRSCHVKGVKLTTEHAPRKVLPKAGLQGGNINVSDASFASMVRKIT